MVHLHSKQWSSLELKGSQARDGSSQPEAAQAPGVRKHTLRPGTLGHPTEFASTRCALGRLGTARRHGWDPLATCGAPGLASPLRARACGRPLDSPGGTSAPRSDPPLPPGRTPLPPSPSPYPASSRPHRPWLLPRWPARRGPPWPHVVLCVQAGGYCCCCCLGGHGDRARMPAPASPPLGAACPAARAGQVQGKLDLCQCPAGGLRSDAGGMQRRGGQALGGSGEGRQRTTQMQLQGRWHCAARVCLGVCWPHHGSARTHPPNQPHQKCTHHAHSRICRQRHTNHAACLSSSGVCVPACVHVRARVYICTQV